MPRKSFCVSIGQPEAVTTPDTSRKEVFHAWPFFLPDGRHFLFIAGPSPFKVYAGSLDSQERKELIGSDSKAEYASPGYLLFVRQGSLMAQPFDAGRLELAGEAFPVAESVRTAGQASGRAAFSLSGNGILAYRAGAGGANVELTWFDRSGKSLGSVGQPGDYRGVALSPDEKRIALRRYENPGGDIWLIDLLREAAATRFTFNAADDHSGPVWSPDGSQLAFKRSLDIYRKISSGAGNEELLVKSGANKYPTDWSRDGRFIIYEMPDPKTKVDLWVLPLTGDRKPVPFLQTEFNERKASFSPDGRWVAYTNLWSVDVKLGISTFEPGIPKPLFVTRIRTSDPVGEEVNYDVSGDGQRFLIAGSRSDDAGGAEPISVILNWNAALSKK